MKLDTYPLKTVLTIPLELEFQDFKNGLPDDLTLILSVGIEFGKWCWDKYPWR